MTSRQSYVAINLNGIAYVFIMGMQSKCKYKLFELVVMIMVH